jgi:hypothetical protein
MDVAEREERRGNGKRIIHRFRRLAQIKEICCRGAKRAAGRLRKEFYPRIATNPAKTGRNGDEGRMEEGKSQGVRRRGAGDCE